MDVIDELIHELGSDDEVARMRAGERLISLGQAAVIPLIKALEDHEHPARHLIAATLGCIGDRSATPALIRALKDKDPLVRLHSAAALGKLKDIRALEPLIHALFDVTCPTDVYSLTGEPLTVRAAAAQSLGELRDSRAVPALIAALSDPNRDVRRAAVQALMQISDQRAIEPLINTLCSEDDEDMCFLIGRAILHIGGEDATQLVKRWAAKNEHFLNKLLVILREVAKRELTATRSSTKQKRKDSLIERMMKWREITIAPTVSASFAVGALLCASCAIYFVAEMPARALMMLAIAAVLATMAGLIISFWHKRERLRQLEFTLKRGRAKNKCS
ncbi:MAG: HEAT repeat domain-containing protein [Armatimonadota bacterium]|nr:HEAT repeat domain-containing protein [Armatimonadota bacterium]MCX7776746.1 HEAT repeat domain-containing protein [Armatimonadota bacterium]MDW8024544.1 HEAT repeat domain-containing protein [Armatimonadota bacterium]